MLASMVIMLVSLRNLNGIPQDRLDLSDHHFRAWTSSCLVKFRWSFSYHWMDCMCRWVYSTTSSMASIRTRLGYWWTSLYIPTLEKDLTTSKSASIILFGRKILPIHIVDMNSF